MRLIDAEKYEERINAHINAIKSDPTLSSVEANKVLSPWYDALYDLRRMPTTNLYEWISVEDRLPDIDPCGKGRYGGTRSVRVLCACKQRDGRTFVKEGYYEPCGNGDVVWRIPGSIDSVTHWMPLPEPPTEKEN